ncbi:MAG: DNA methyltransferase [Gemmatimonadetes bacterium]|nr:DNA methyltransferase [Gemmatimonadota bacterium]
MTAKQLTLSIESPASDWLKRELADFNAFGQNTIVTSTETEQIRLETYVNEFWTSKQREANALHEISYRACFKPQLPRFFIERLTLPGDVVYDPFAGRGTTLIESALLGRIPIGCDINPLSSIMTLPRLNPPTTEQVADRLSHIELKNVKYPKKLLVFYHPETLKQICSLKKYLIEKASKLDWIDQWIRLVALSRLTGHSSGFFSVYTLPPNQAVSVDSQKKINHKRNQEPPLRDVKNLILKKTRDLLKHCDDQIRKILGYASNQAHFLTQPSDSIPEIGSNSVSLVVTSPPFLDVVNYAQDNWLRCWFCGIDPAAVPITMARKVEQWQREMTKVFLELERVLKPGGHIAFEVGEVRHGKVKLEEAVIPCGIEAGLTPLLVLINDQKFTKTANVWGVDNTTKGTNTNRVVVFQKE